MFSLSICLAAPKERFPCVTFPDGAGGLIVKSVGSASHVMRAHAAARWCSIPFAGICPVAIERPRNAVVTKQRRRRYCLRQDRDDQAGTRVGPISW
jgi:3-oxoacyl-[acyl-carrier-protein] synthase III